MLWQTWPLSRALGKNYYPAPTISTLVLVQLADAAVRGGPHTARAVGMLPCANRLRSPSAQLSPWPWNAVCGLPLGTHPSTHWPGRKCTTSTASNSCASSKSTAQSMHVMLAPFAADAAADHQHFSHEAVKRMHGPFHAHSILMLLACAYGYRQWGLSSIAGKCSCSLQSLTHIKPVPSIQCNSHGY